MFNKHIMSNVDIVTTNPPFSKAIKFLDSVSNCGCNYVFIGSNIFIQNKISSILYWNGNLSFGYNNNVNVWFNNGVDKVCVSWYTSFKTPEPIWKRTNKSVDCFKYNHPEERDDVLFLVRYDDYPDDYYGWVAFACHKCWKISRDEFECESFNPISFTVDKRKKFRRYVIKRIKNG